MSWKDFKKFMKYKRFDYTDVALYFIILFIVAVIV